ncbi:glycosyltransferase family 31 protein [Zasmidium cellare ATCC 36951]|uniref:N-acetylgalactosaminide beta-1,3-galactosyltransferase n=1 Tax=Zasmidium cellare ATCC 36951 TaxID=1080233 RepID=A0A6A6C5P9_ZASCE|nr:glycosyltransferase family 31 protein [Zasmidium cellare ATCC 36951]KAF2161069.1 glycosyltransferase family 31 protein [Zasmidium cellare ATCC 36951]
MPAQCDHSARSLPRRKTPQPPLPCSQLPGANDTVVVLKTSAAEIEARLPIHLSTTLLCYPHAIIFSDYAENFEGYPVYDALASVDRRIKDHHPDFELWRRLQRDGPDGLEDEELWDAETTTRGVDKWKYLPMLAEAFAKFPGKKWFVLLETGTFVLWGEVLRFLGRWDSERMWYFGDEGVEGEVVFARKGAGVVLSWAAVRALVELYAETRAAWEAYTEMQTAGDVVLAQALSEVGVEVTPAWPVFQSQRLADVQYDQVSEGRRLWCSPTVSYGGVEKGNVEELWKFEQGWMKENPDQPLLHQHIFTSFILPRLVMRSGRVDDWDNLSNDSPTPAANIDECRGMCVEDEKCVQYSFTNGRCRLSRTPRMGEFKRGVESRWLLARVKRWGEEMGDYSEVQGCLTDDVYS